MLIPGFNACSTTDSSFMMLQHIKLSNSLDSRLFIAISIILTVIYVAHQRLQKGLNRYPGPLIASFTNIWRALDVYHRDTHITYRKLHAKYGDVVRVAPNVLSFADPGAIPEIYGLNKGFTKVSGGSQMPVLQYS